MTWQVRRFASHAHWKDHSPRTSMYAHRGRLSVASKTTIGSFARSWQKGRFFMQRETAKWVKKAEDDWSAAQDQSNRKPPLRDVACFHCQQCVEKYLKALLQENGGVIPK